MSTIKPIYVITIEVTNTGHYVKYFENKITAHKYGIVTSYYANDNNPENLDKYKKALDYIRYLGPKTEINEKLLWGSYKLDTITSYDDNKVDIQNTTQNLYEDFNNYEKRPNRAIISFLKSSKVKFGPDCSVSDATFMENFFEHCRDINIPRPKWTSACYKEVFDQLNITCKKFDDKKVYFIGLTITSCVSDDPEFINISKLLDKIDKIV